MKMVFFFKLNFSVIYLFNSYLNIFFVVYMAVGELYQQGKL